MPIIKKTRYYLFILFLFVSLNHNTFSQEIQNEYTVKFTTDGINIDGFDNNSNSYLDPFKND